VHLHDLRSPAGARKKARRPGRGTGSGQGKTSGRGQKGQLARSQGFRLGFEGGQMPLAQRLPSLGGFKNPFKKVFSLVNLTRLNAFEDGAHLTPESLQAAGLARPGQEIKLLGAGKLRRRVQVEVHALSETARRAIEKQGGSVRLLESKQRVSAGTRKRAGGDSASATP
jgi:large subunit ribosomal protein L15